MLVCSQSFLPTWSQGFFNWMGSKERIRNLVGQTTGKTTQEEQTMTDKTQAESRCFCRLIVTTNLLAFPSPSDSLLSCVAALTHLSWSQMILLPWIRHPSFSSPSLLFYLPAAPVLSFSLDEIGFSLIAGLFLQVPDEMMWAEVR